MLFSPEKAREIRDALKNGSDNEDSNEGRNESSRKAKDW